MAPITFQGNEPLSFFMLSECCHTIEVQGGGDVQIKQPHIFTTYTLETDIVNGHVHYTSQDGTWAIAYVDSQNPHWAIQLVEDR